MARIRSIKPEFWTDEKVVELSPFARLLFIGLWNFADDEGRMIYSPTRIKLQILPADSADISELLGEILGKSLITVYAVDGIEYLQVNGFSEHQKIDKRSASKLPSPPNPAESRRIPTTDQGRDQGRDQGGGAKKSSRKTSLPADFCISERVKQWAQEKGHHSLQAHFEKFVGAVKAKGYTYVDWDEAFMGAIRDNWAKVPPKAEQRRVAL